MSLYNMKADGDHWRITKFTPDIEVESSYLVSAEACDCPAGHRHTCRHRQMLPMFEAKNATRGQFFLDFDRKVWLPAICDDEQTPSSLEPTLASISSNHEQTLVARSSEEPYGRGPMMNAIPLLEADQARQMETIRASAAAHGFTMLDLANPRATHNAIAEALGEPRVGYERQGSGYDPDAKGHELQGRDAAPEPKPLRRI